MYRGPVLSDKRLFVDLGLNTIIECHQLVGLGNPCILADCALNLFGFFFVEPVHLPDIQIAYVFDMYVCVFSLKK
jgi:hypothetical protein